LEINSLEIRNLRYNLNMNQDQFAKALGVSKRSVVNYESGDTLPRGDVRMKMEAIAKAAKEKNMAFRRQIHGVEEEKVQLVAKEHQGPYYRDPNIMMVPMVAHRAQAGFLAGWADEQAGIDDLPKIPWEVDREYKGRYVCFEVNGDSMDDNTPQALLEGDVILCREVMQQHWQNKLHINQWDFVVVHKEKGIVVKRIMEHEVESGNLLLHSLNDMYDDYDVNLKDCIAIFNVVDVKRSRRR
jgi:DNA-binding XRE family transcriptional regulator